MKFVVGILGFILGATTTSVVLCEFSQSLTVSITWISLLAGAGLAGLFIFSTRKVAFQFPHPGLFDWAMGFFFFLFCFRFFGWLLYQKGGGYFTLDGNNFGDLPWHITSIENLARAQKFWPENPILTVEKFHYPFGIDMFGALFLKLGVPLQNLLPVTGFICGILFLLALYLWGGGFALGGFLFSGGVAGFTMIKTGYLRDYQADLAWKSLPLALYITQRGLIYAFPAGLILIWSWRRRFLLKKDGLPLWIEGLLWGTMPLFHIHTFLLLSALFAVWTLHSRKWKTSLTLFLVAVIPATYEMCRLTDNFRRASILAWNPGWMISSSHLGFWGHLWDGLLFFLLNYGMFFPLTIMAVFLAWRHKKDRWDLVILPAGAIYLLCLFVKFAPWDWDNTKLMAWCYILALPVIWEMCVFPIRMSLKVPLVLSLFLSGFICVYSVYGNLSGFELYRRDVVDEVCAALENIPQEARLATAQTHNHPVLLCGHKVVAGYAGHLWSHGIPGHEVIEGKLTRLMNGDGDWRDLAKQIQARYLFWGEEEARAFANSKKPWVDSVKKVAEGSWGQIYDLGE